MSEGKDFQMIEALPSIKQKRCHPLFNQLPNFDTDILLSDSGIIVCNLLQLGSTTQLISKGNKYMMFNIPSCGNNAGNLFLF